MSLEIVSGLAQPESQIEKDVRIVTAFNSGETMSEIAAREGVSVVSISKRLERIEIAQHRRELIRRGEDDYAQVPILNRNRPRRVRLPRS